MSGVAVAALRLKNPFLPTNWGGASVGVSCCLYDHNANTNQLKQALRGLPCFQPVTVTVQQIDSILCVI